MNANSATPIGKYHSIGAYVPHEGKSLWIHQDFFAFGFNLDLRMYQVLINFLGSLMWINVDTYYLTFAKEYPNCEDL
jgi:hypothetical protein